MLVLLPKRLICDINNNVVYLSTCTVVFELITHSVPTVDQFLHVEWTARCAFPLWTIHCALYTVLDLLLVRGAELRGMLASLRTPHSPAGLLELTTALALQRSPRDYTYISPPREGQRRWAALPRLPR